LQLSQTFEQISFPPSEIGIVCANLEKLTSGLLFLHQIQICSLIEFIVANVRRYVALAQSRGGACFCTRGAVQDYDVVLSLIALAKTVTPVGAPGGSRGRPHRRPPSDPL